MRRDPFVCRLAFAAPDKFDGSAKRRTDGEGFQSIYNIDLGSLQDLAPTKLVIAFFQLVVLKQPIPDVERVLGGLALIMLGLTFFIQGLQIGLFPIGETMAGALTRKGSLFWLLAFAFLLDYPTTPAKPALIAVAAEAAETAAEGGFVAANETAEPDYALGLRMTVAFSVGIAILPGAFQIPKGWPIHYLIIGGYFAVVLLIFVAPLKIIGVLYNSRGVTTSTVTVPPGHRARHRPGQHHSRA